MEKEVKDVVGILKSKGDAQSSTGKPFFKLEIKSGEELVKLNAWPSVTGLVEDLKEVGVGDQVKCYYEQNKNFRNVKSIGKLGDRPDDVRDAEKFAEDIEEGLNKVQEDKKYLSPQFVGLCMNQAHDEVLKNGGSFYEVFEKIFYRNLEVQEKLRKEGFTF